MFNSQGLHLISATDNWLPDTANSRPQNTCMFPEPEPVPPVPSTSTQQPKPKKTTANLSVSETYTVNIPPSTTSPKKPKKGAVLGVATQDGDTPIPAIKKELPFDDDDGFDDGMANDDGEFFDDVTKFEPMVKEEIPQSDSERGSKKRKRTRPKRGEVVEKKPRKKIGRPRGSGWNQKGGIDTDKVKKPKKKKPPQKKKKIESDDDEKDEDYKQKDELDDEFGDGDGQEKGKKKRK